MDDWNFGAWRDALRDAGPSRAVLVGLAAAERAAGCLQDDRAARFGAEGPAQARELLEACWRGADPQRTSARAEALADWATAYLERSLTEEFHAWGPEDDDEDDGGPLELADFLADAEPAGAVALHLTAAIAVSEAAAACAGGAWDGALRCLQSLADLPGEPQRQQADLALVLAAPDAGLTTAAEALRRRATGDARGHRAHCEALALDAD
ncbi:hypothetical protein [Kitasatospora paranensis]|uniref:Tetratricopeptide repeat protein n=1 Tax=Kitasatospora paranensis TaxID=258053 RepID=A0ABW2FR66_9ACTN